MKILLAVDGSEYGEWATDFLSALPLATSPSITVLHVVEPLPTVHALFTPTERQAYTRALREQAVHKRSIGQAIVKRTADRLRRRWKRARALVDEGPAAETILATAKRERTDLIILGSRGLGHLQQFMMGSVTQKVATYAPCSVLVVKQRTRRLRHILVALDGSPCAEDAAAFVGSMLALKGGRAIAMYVWEAPDLVPVPESAADGIRKRCDRVMRRAGLAHEFAFVTGNPARQIVRMAEQRKVELVVVGSRGLTGLKRFLLGAVSNEVVLRSPASVLVVRR